MNITIVRTVKPNERFKDADTGRIDAANPETPEPMRVLPRPDGELAQAVTQPGRTYISPDYATKLAQKEKDRQASLKFWVFRQKLVRVDDCADASREEVVIRVKHKVLSERNAFEKLKRDVELFDKLETSPASPREPIPEDVRIFIWRRDEGRCVRCGSQQRIEFDHIIPLDKGGSNTARNLQVLCERCNREKGTTI